MKTLTETQVRLFASAQSWIEGEAVRQLYATAKLEGVRIAVGFPDLHPGKGMPVGAAFVTEGMIYPHVIGGDIGCGMLAVALNGSFLKAANDPMSRLPFVRFRSERLPKILLVGHW
jgi:RNA-splicing ligase RtcB